MAPLIRAGSVALLGVAVVLALIAPVSMAQDWAPFAVATEMHGQWTALYPSPAARDLYDTSPALKAKGLPRVPAPLLAAFIAPPPAAWLPAGSLLIWRLLLVCPLLLALLWGRVEPATWGLYAPLLFLIVVVGQPSAWLVTAAIVSVSAPSRRLDALGTVCLAAGVLAKLTPLLVVVGLLAIGRRRMALWALGLIAVSIALTWPWTGIEAWRAFFASASHLSAVVVPSWNNASIDALVLRHLTGQSDTGFVVPSARLGLLLTMVRGGLLVGVLAVAWRAKSIALLWVAWVVASPLVWLHYLAVLIPALKGRVGSVCAGLLSVPVLLRFADVSESLIGDVTFGGLAVSAMVLLVWCLPRREPVAALQLRAVSG